MEENRPQFSEKKCHFFQTTAKKLGISKTFRELKHFKNVFLDQEHSQVKPCFEIQPGTIVF